MHTESTITRTQAYIARYRARIAVALGVTLSLVLALAWLLLAPAVLGIHAPSLAACVGALSILGGLTVALAFYWGAE